MTRAKETKKKRTKKEGINKKKKERESSFELHAKE